MKIKILIVTILLITCFTITRAQSYKNGDINVYGGIGLGEPYGLFSAATSWPSLILGADKGIFEVNNVGVIAVGGILGITHYTYSYSIIGFNGSDYSWTNYDFGGRGIFHLTSLSIDKVDLYGGLTLGLEFYKDWGGSNTLDTHVGLLTGFFIGGKYSINDKLSGFAELGRDIAWLKLGINYKLN